MKTREVITGLIVVIVFVLAIFIFKNYKSDKSKSIPSATPSIEQRISAKFNGIEIPKNLDKADLSPVNGSVGEGIATRNYEKGKFEVTVLADLPDPKAGTYYEVILSDSSGKSISLGKMRLAKGGYLTDFVSSSDFTAFSKVRITLKSISTSAEGQSLLEGSF